MPESDKYIQLLERSVRCQEESNVVSKSLLKVAEGLKDNTKKLNDTFILHNRDTDDIKNALGDIKGTLLKWIKWLGVALFIAIGGATVIKIIGIDLSSLF